MVGFVSRQLNSKVCILYRILEVNVVAVFLYSSTSGKIDVWCDISGHTVYYTSVGEN